MRRLILVLAVASILVSGCSKEHKETEPVVIEPETIEHLSDSVIVFDMYGDTFKYQLREDEVLLDISSTSATISLSKVEPIEVYFEYVQGVSLNDWGKCYHAAFTGEKSDYVDSGFTTDEYVYKFIHSEKNCYLMIRCAVEYSRDVDKIYEEVIW